LLKISDSDYEKWKSEFQRLEKEIDYFRIHFNKIRKCKCSSEECKHFRNERHRIFGERIDNLYNLRLGLGLQFYSKIIKSKN